MPISIKQIRAPVVVRSRKLGEFRLRFLSTRDFRELSLLGSSLTPREYSVRVVHHQLEMPLLDLDSVRSLPNRLLAALVSKWSKDVRCLNRPLPHDKPIFVGFKQVFEAYIKEQSNVALEAANSSLSSISDIVSRQLGYLKLLEASRIPDLYNLTRFAGMTEALKAAAAVVRPFPTEIYSKPVFDLMAGLAHGNILGLTEGLVNTAFSGLTDSIQRLSGALSSFPTLPHFEGQIASFQVSSSLALQSRTLLTDIADIVNRDSTVFSHMGPLVTDAFKLSSAYGVYMRGQLHEGIKDDWPDAGSLHDDVVIPAAATAFGLSAVKEIAARVARAETSGEILLDKSSVDSHQPPLSDVDSYLSRLRPRFVEQRHGAWDALKSQNPDRLRQAAHSGRELFAQVLHELAPDNCFSADEISQRSSNGGVTRKMRITRILNTNGRSTLVGLIATLAGLGDDLYAQLSAAAHSREDDIRESDVEGFLGMLDYLMLILSGR